jgi:hypothetical protein
MGKFNENTKKITAAERILGMGTILSIGGVFATTIFFLASIGG